MGSLKRNENLQLLANQIDSRSSQVLQVNSEDSMAMARDLAKKEGLFVGISAGAAVKVSLFLLSFASLAQNAIDLPRYVCRGCVLVFRNDCSLSLCWREIVRK